MNNILKNSSQKLKNTLINLYKESDYDFSLNYASNEESQSSQTNEPQKIFNNLSKNLDYLNYKYNTLINSDIVIRKLKINALDKQYDAFIVYIDGMVDSERINLNLLKPLMHKNLTNLDISSKDISQNYSILRSGNKKNVNEKNNLINFIYNSLITQNDIKKTDTFKDILLSINKGHCLLFVDTLNVCFNLDVKNFKQRSIDTPNNEIIIRGSQEAFNEVLRTNTSLIRRVINNENLIIENFEVGSVNRTAIGICYMKNIANESLVSEVKYRISNIDIDYLTSSGQLEQLIQDNGNSTLPQVIATERPDKVSNFILEGRVAIIVNGSPYILIVPGVLADFLASPEDYNLKHQFTNVLKIIRTIGLLLTTLLPGIYIAITTFHEELIPTELLFSIVASRESVPFPIIFEILTMELAFELIKEASVRIPSAIGQTIGIVGALILGQAAVDASIVSPILIIIVAITGICSFTIPDFSLGFHCRLLRFLYIIFGYLAGFLGIALVLFVHLVSLTNLKSFGVPYLQSFFSNNSKNKLLLPASWKRELRSRFLNTKKKSRQNEISMKWKQNNSNI